MRDILNDLEAGRLLSDPDPMRRAQLQMRTPMPKRFYKEAAVAERDGGFTIELDGKPVKTPGKSLLVLPTARAAQLVADEFSAQEERLDLATMPVYRLVNTAIDGVAADPQAVIEDILRFSSSDLLCYRAAGPDTLVRRQDEAWDPVIDWARTALGARLNLAEGVIHVEQPKDAIAALGVHLGQRAEPVRLAALHVMTTLTGSALLALSVDFGELDIEAAWRAANIDEDFQAEQWGHDAEAVARNVARKRDMTAAASLIEAMRA
ncbi:ATP12 family chaperone protein [Mesorhizobium marinum]|uniref:ATP12 family chaperone protein n=1 Tax=Mesorhizobium marinum TaxID=3228790 RepID=UPI003465CE5E